MSEPRVSTCSELCSARYEVPYSPDRFNRTTLLLQWVGNAKDVLELGCSTGYISRLLSEQGCRVIGVESDPDAAAKAVRYCTRVVQADLDRAGWAVALPPDFKFDVIVLGDVLEHLAHPERVLRQLPPLLKPNGYLVISLPNVVHWATRLKIVFGRFEYEPIGTLDATHVRFFTCRTARELIEEAGYRVLEFHPAIGGRMSGHLRPVWQLLARLMPGLFAYQLLFRAAPLR
jgi:methionine biosynthesis protein MetW